MRTTNRWLLAGLLGVAALSAQAHDHGAEAAMAGGSAADCWTPAFKAGDADAVAACYLPDAVMHFPGGPTAVGREAIRDGYAHFFADYTISDAVIRETGRREHGDDLTAWGTFTITMVSRKDGTVLVQTGRFTDVQTRVDGQWRYVVDHASDDPPPPAPAPAG